MLHTKYLQRVVDKAQFRQAILDAKETLKDVNFDSIAVCGVSGLFGAALSVALNKHLLIVRRENDKHFAEFSTEYNDVAQRYIFVDDHVCKSHTLIHVCHTLDKLNLKFVGTYLYHSKEYGCPQFIQVS